MEAEAAESHVDDYENGHGDIPWYHKEEWLAGEVAWFEYHCWENADSADAEAWYRSHQKVEVLGRGDDEAELMEGTTFRERTEELGVLKVYRVRFADGLEWDVFEDELSTSTEAWWRPDPPTARV